MRNSTRPSRKLTPSSALSSPLIVTPVSPAVVRLSLKAQSDPRGQQTQVTCPLRIRVSRQPGLHPSKRGITVGNLDPDRYPPLDEPADLTGELAQMPPPSRSPSASVRPKRARSFPVIRVIRGSLVCDLSMRGVADALQYEISAYRTHEDPSQFVADRESSSRAGGRRACAPAGISE